MLMNDFKGFDAQTQLLTTRGWVYFPDILPEDCIAQVGLDMVMFFDKAELVHQEYKGALINTTTKGGKIDLNTSPNQDLLWQCIDAKGNITNKCVEASKPWVGSIYKNLLRTTPVQNNGETLTWLDRLKIAFQADGYFYSTDRTTKQLGLYSGMLAVGFNFAKQRKVDRLIWLCEGGGFKYSIHTPNSRKEQQWFRVWLPVGIKLSKSFDWIPPINKFCANWCRQFIEEVSHWDACVRSERSIGFSTTNQSVALAIESIALCAGYGVLAAKPYDTGNPNHNTLYALGIIKGNTTSTQKFARVLSNYEGVLYNLKTNTGLILVKRNKATAISSSLI